MQVFKGSYEDYLRFRAGEAAALEQGEAQAGLAWVEDYTPPPVSKRAQRDQAHRRYVLGNAIEDAEFRLQLLTAQRDAAAEAGEEARTAELAGEIAVVQQELADLNEELERLVG